MADQVNPFLSAQRAKPTANPESSTALARSTLFGETKVAPLHSKTYELCDEGSYFVATNATPGTGIAGHAAPTTLDDTKPYFLLYNQALATSTPSKRIYLDYLRMRVTAVGTGGTAVNLAIKTDAGDRRSSAGTAITPVCPNADSTASPSARLHAGPVVATAATSAARLVSHHQVRPVISVVEDVYLFNFGASGSAAGPSAPNGTAIAVLHFNLPPIILGPASSLLVHIWQPSQSAASSYEFELGFWER